MDKMREEFQKWFYDQTGLQCKFDSYDNAFVTKSSGSTGDTIVNTSCCIAWQAWKASRAALFVDIGRAYQQGGMMSDYLVEQALDDAGVSHN